MKITFYEIGGWEAAYIKKKLKSHSVKCVPEPMDDKNADSKADYISPFIYSKVDKKALAKLKKCRGIMTRSTGFDHIDLRECKKRKIIVSNVPFYGENTVAEHTFALILSISRNIYKSYQRVCRDGNCGNIMGFDLADKTIGIIGGGHIGMHVARMAKAFGMHVRVYDMRKDDFLSEVLAFKYCELDELLKVSDIVSLHLPHNEHTHHIINSKSLKKMKKGAVLINTARGGLVDTDALLKSLKSGKISGAGLDVIEGEESINHEEQLLRDGADPEKMKALLCAHQILDLDTVIFTPHNAFNSKEARMRILDTTVENIMGAIEKKPSNLVG